MEDADDYKKYAAELIGTFALVFFGCGSAVIAGGISATTPNHIGFLGISLAFGLTVLAMCYAIGPISGCHVNPAITLAMLTAGKIKGKDAVTYILAQCVGAILGASVLYAIASGLPGYSLSVNGLGTNGYDALSPEKYSMVSCFLAEVVLTFLFLMVIFGATSKKAPAGFAGIPIGLSLTIIHLVGIPITGTSVNPARSLGPALVAQGEALNQLWLFWAAPIVGGIIAALVWTYVLEDREPKKKTYAEKDYEDDEELDEDDEEEPPKPAPKVSTAHRSEDERSSSGPKQPVKKAPPKSPAPKDEDDEDEDDEDEDDEDEDDEDEDEDDEVEDEDEEDVPKKKK